MAGFNYKTAPETVEEVYDVQTGIRRIGSYILQTSNLTTGQYLPPFAPIYADKVHKKAYAVCNVKVYEAALATATEIKIKKNSLAYVGMFLTNGTKTITVTKIDNSVTSYDVITVKTAAGEAIAAGDVLFETSAEDGTTQKYIANSALYGKWTVVNGINNISLLRSAGEIETEKLTIPFTSADKENMKGWFQFND